MLAAAACQTSSEAACINQVRPCRLVNACRFHALQALQPTKLDIVRCIGLIEPGCCQQALARVHKSNKAAAFKSASGKEVPQQTAAATVDSHLHQAARGMADLCESVQVCKAETR